VATASPSKAPRRRGFRCSNSRSSSYAGEG
jgi:hypothetical protein